MAMVMRRAAAYALATLLLGAARSSRRARPESRVRVSPAASRRVTARNRSRQYRVAPREDFDEMLITTPLGQGVARIVREGDQVTLTTAEPREYHARRRRVAHRAGARLPSAARRARRLGARPAFPDLEQRGWKVEYQEYAGELPSRLRVLYPGIELRLIISRWK